MAQLEVACFNPESAVVAGEAGADRIELCDDRDVGGVTPPREWLSWVKARVDVPVFVMLRPRGGDFVYTREEFEGMKADLDRFKTEADGLVFGILHHGGTIDIQRTKELVEQASPLPCTFHRAFDETPDPIRALEDVIATGCQWILSSGGAPDAHTGVAVLRALVQEARGRMMVMPGGGVRLQNLIDIQQATGATMFHSSAMTTDARLPDMAEIRQMKQALQGQELLISADSSRVKREERSGETEDAH